MLQMGKVRSREGEGLAPDYTASQWLSRNSNPGLLVPRTEFFSMAFWRVSGVSILGAAGRQRGGRVGY